MLPGGKVCRVKMFMSLPSVPVFLEEDGRQGEVVAF